ncbi:hypothetical protein G4B88_026670 [Cannabis sativa]|uniref:Uncharacterized protein n=1 Tax=Cannabis sativa TaxID=3483 RepID=A0A7J6F6L4_CANSA|nr:hypothetical protein G4B88_026670 [Cannabis sativa]
MLQFFFTTAFSAIPLTLYIPPPRNLNLFVETMEDALRESKPYTDRLFPRARRNVGSRWLRTKGWTPTVAMAGSAAGSGESSSINADDFTVPIPAVNEAVNQGNNYANLGGLNEDIRPDPWFVDDLNPFVESRHPALTGAFVKSLMKIDDNEWDEEVISDVLTERDQELIWKIPPSNGNSSDTWSAGLCLGSLLLLGQQ